MTIAAEQTSIFNLPMECLEIILVKAYVLYFHYLNEKDEKWLFNQLASISSFWFDTIARRRFKNCLHRHFVAYFSHIGKQRAIVRNNRRFLREYIQPTVKFIHQLQSFGCLTTEQAKHIDSLSSKRDKNEELYNLIRSFDRRWYLCFIECLRRSRQNLVAGIIEKGGATVKLKLSSMHCAQWSSKKQQLVKSLNQLQNKDKQRIRQLEMEISCLRRFDIEILGAKVTKEGIEIWFWCHSEAGLQKLGNDNFVFDTLTGLFQCFSSSLERSLCVVDPLPFRSNLRQFERKKVVTCPTVAIHLQTRIHIATRQKQSVLGVAQLDDKIYALIKFPDFHLIQVYQDQILISKLTIDIEEIVEPKCLAACHRTKCLYILDKGGFNNNEADHEGWSIWKIDLTETEQEAFLWLDESNLYDVSPNDNICEEIISMSVSSKAHLLLLKYDSHKRPDLCHLDAYKGDSYATPPQRCFRPVAVKVKDPHHAIETARGHFLISYGYRNLSGVSEVTRSGDVVRYFHHFDPRDQSEPLVEPVYLEMGSYGRVLVASKSNSRVILIDPQLDTYEVLLTANDHGIDKPTQLSYCRDKKQVLVIHQSGKKLDIYYLSDTTL